MFGMSWADTFRVLLMGLFILVCIAITIVVLMQESKQTGLSGAISGAADTYWGKNKGRSMEGKLVKRSEEHTSELQSHHDLKDTCNRIYCYCCYIEY
mgnify:CR=1 FL=1